MIVRELTGGMYFGEKLAPLTAQAICDLHS